MQENIRSVDMRSFRLVLVSVIALAVCAASSEAGWLIYHKPDFKGIIIDIETKEPIEGAVVVVIYYKSLMISGPAGGHRSMLDIRETLTDKNGEFYIPSYTAIIQPLSEEDKANFIIYKPGYANIGEINLEGTFSGQETRDYEGAMSWNKELKFKYSAAGVVELPKLTTREEMDKARRSADIFGAEISVKELPLLYKTIEDYKNSGMK